VMRWCNYQMTCPNCRAPFSFDEPPEWDLLRICVWIAMGLYAISFFMSVFEKRI
jgi:hypothetical protein